MDEFDVLDVLEAIESAVKESFRIPVSGLRAVDRAMLEGLVALAREEIELGQHVPRSVLSREEVLAQAEGERRLLVENARREADELLREERIKEFTRRRFDEIVEEGREQAERVTQEAYGYSARRLSEAVKRMHKLREQVEGGLETLRDALQEMEKSRRQRKREEARRSRKN